MLVIRVDFFIETETYIVLPTLQVFEQEHGKIYMKGGDQAECRQSPQRKDGRSKQTCGRR